MDSEIGRIVVVTAPTNKPVSPGELRAHSRIQTSDEDTYLADLIDSATETVEEFTRRRLVTQTVDEFFDDWPCGSVIRLGASPIQTVTSVKYTDEAGAESPLSSADYVVDAYSSPPKVLLKRDLSWPDVTLREANAIVVRYVAGYGAAPPNLPERLRHAVLYIAGTAYEHRENRVVGTIVSEMDDTAEALMWPYRILEAVS